MDEIIKIVLLRNKQRKLLSKSDIKRICEIIIGINNFSDVNYIKFEKCDPEDENCGGKCMDDHLVFYTDGVEKIMDETYKCIVSHFNLDGCKVDILNFVYLIIIFHEFAHVRQYELIGKRKGTLEEKLYLICDKLMLIKDFYEKNYCNMLTEVNAFAKGAFDAYSVYSKLPKEYLTEKDKIAYQTYALEEAFDFYYADSNKEKVMSPAERLYLNADQYNVSKCNVDINKFKELVYGDHNLTMYRKLTMGLPITYQEYAYINLMDDSIRDGQDINFIKKLRKKL